MARKSPQEKVVEKTNKIIKQLGLTEKQAEEVKTSILSRNKAVQEQNKIIRNSERAIKKAKREYRKKLNTILTSDQQKKLVVIREQNKVKKEG